MILNLITSVSSFGLMMSGGLRHGYLWSIIFLPATLGFPGSGSDGRGQGGCWKWWHQMEGLWPQPSNSRSRRNRTTLTHSSLHTLPPKQLAQLVGCHCDLCLHLTQGGILGLAVSPSLQICSFLNKLLELASGCQRAMEIPGEWPGE